MDISSGHSVPTTGRVDGSDGEGMERWAVSSGAGGDGPVDRWITCWPDERLSVLPSSCPAGENGEPRLIRYVSNGTLLVCTTTENFYRASKWAALKRPNGLKRKISSYVKLSRI
jgi:hypothetical protein